jgi:sec-independent protein translocase protein TatC
MTSSSAPDPAPQLPPDEGLQDEGMTFWEHLDELRSRIMKMILALIVMTGVSWYFQDPVLMWLVGPLRDAWIGLELPGEPTLNFADPAGGFMLSLKVSLFAGVVLSMPFHFYQVWAFVAPGLYPKEKRMAFPFVLASTSLFVTGAMFGMKLALPVALHYLLSFVRQVPGFNLEPELMAKEYVSFIMQMLLVFGGVFELPVIALFLSLTGIVTHVHLIKFFRYFIVVAFVIGAIFTPPDLTSQFLLAVPLIALYGVSIGVAYLVTKARGARAARESAS